MFYKPALTAVFWPRSRLSVQSCSDWREWAWNETSCNFFIIIVAETESLMRDCSHTYFTEEASVKMVCSSNISIIGWHVQVTGLWSCLGWHKQCAASWHSRTSICRSSVKQYEASQECWKQVLKLLTVLTKFGVQLHSCFQYHIFINAVFDSNYKQLCYLFCCISQ